MSQYDITYSYLPGKDNSVADALSRIEQVAMPIVRDNGGGMDRDSIEAIGFPQLFNIKELHKLQFEDSQLQTILKDPKFPLQLKKLTWDPEGTAIFCNEQGGLVRPFVPSVLRSIVLHLYHAYSHPSARVMVQMIRKKYVWPSMARDVAMYCRTCIACQTSKISRHNKPIPAHFDVPDARL